MAIAAALNQLWWNPGDLATSVAQNLKALLPDLWIEPTAWVEISPYGFVSRNYFLYSANRLEGCAFSVLEDGTRIVRFRDDSMIIESPSGHLVELDKRRRVVLVKVTKAEAEGAQASLGRQELSECYKVTANSRGQSVMVMPGNVVIRQDDENVSVTMPNGTLLYAKKSV